MISRVSARTITRRRSWASTQASPLLYLKHALRRSRTTLMASNALTVVARSWKSAFMSLNLHRLSPATDSLKASSSSSLASTVSPSPCPTHRRRKLRLRRILSWPSKSSTLWKWFCEFAAWVSYSKKEPICAATGTSLISFALSRVTLAWSAVVAPKSPVSEPSVYYVPCVR